MKSSLLKSAAVPKSKYLINKALKHGYRVIDLASTDISPACLYISADGTTGIDVRGSHPEFCEVTNISFDRPFDDGWIRKADSNTYQFDNASLQPGLVNAVEKMIVNEAKKKSVIITFGGHYLETAKERVIEKGLAKLLSRKSKTAAATALQQYAQRVVDANPSIDGVYLVGSAVAGAGRDIDLLYDFGQVGLGESPEAAVETLLEAQEGIDLDSYDTFVLVDNRYFHVSSGAGRGVVENTEYGQAQQRKPMIKLAKTSAKHASTQINLPEELAKKLQEAVRKVIPESDLMADGYEDSPHITVKYGVEEDEQ